MVIHDILLHARKAGRMNGIWLLCAILEIGNKQIIIVPKAKYESYEVCMFDKDEMARLNIKATCIRQTEA